MNRSSIRRPVTQSAVCWAHWVGLTLLLAACGASTGGDKVGGETNFLSTCKDASVCGEDLTCSCGICTRPCTSSADCSSASDGVCSADDTVSGMAACGSVPAEALCVVSQAAPSDVGDSGASDAPTWTELEQVERFDQEYFSHIWGAADELWIVGQELLPPTTGPAVPSDEPPPPSKLRRMDLSVASGARQWELMPSPVEATVIDLHGSSPTDIWAVVFPGDVYHFDGNEWQAHDVLASAGVDFEPSDLIDGFSATEVYALDSDDVWLAASMTYELQSTAPLFHFDGSQWTMHSREPDNVQSFWASSTDDVWAVTEVGRVLHFDGAGWQQVHEAPRSGAGLTSRIDSIFGTGPDDIWITGFRGLIEHYDGQGWTNVRARDDHTGSGPIAGSAEQGLWTFLTNYEEGSEEQQVLRLRDGEWQVFSSKATAEDELMDLWVTDQGEVWVVGREIVRLR